MPGISQTVALATTRRARSQLGDGFRSYPDLDAIRWPLDHGHDAPITRGVVHGSRRRLRWLPLPAANAAGNVVERAKITLVRVRSAVAERRVQIARRLLR